MNDDTRWAVVKKRHGALTIYTEKPVCPDEMSNGTVQLGENFPEWKECLRRYSSFFVSTEMTGISCTICKNLTRAILSHTADDFVNLALIAPVYRAQ